MADYEQIKLYSYKDISVRSEIVRDNFVPEVNMRVICIRSSCPSTRWAGRTSDFLCQGPEKWPAMALDLENARLSAAEALAKQELGEISDKVMPALGVDIHGRNGKKLRSLASFCLVAQHCLLQPEVIRALELEPTGERYWFGGAAPVSVPVYRGDLMFGELKVTTTFVPSEHNGALLLGGDFLHRAVSGREYVLQEVLYREQDRVLESIARTKKNTVLIIGAFGKYRERLNRIKTAIQGLGFHGVIIDEFRAIEEQEFTEKMLTFASIARFIIADDFSPSGHIKELDICHYMKFITAVLRLKQRPTTAMQDDLSRGVDFIKEFGYAEDCALEETARAAATWADDAVRTRARDLNIRYGRGPFDVL